MKLKPFPSMREKRRYIIFKVHSEEKLNYPNVRNAVYNSVGNWLGEKEMARANVHIIKNLWDSKGQTGFVRCSHKFVDDVRVGLSLIHQVGDSRVIFHTLAVAGTIKSGKWKLNKAVK